MQTAVEFLFAHLLPFLDWSKREDRIKFRQLEQEALNMEKQQIIDAFELWRTGSGEQYYNETYGSKGSDETKTDKI